MQLGIGLPNSLPYGLDRRLFLDWARAADAAGFHCLATLDRPNYDMWDPLAALAAAAAVTERARLVTAVMQLPNRNEVLVAKQAAVIDRVSDGRLDLGVALGGRADDYEAFGAGMEHRVSRFRRQVRRLREIWTGAREGTQEGFGPLGPAPVQERIPIWIGANPNNEPGQRRAVALGDGFILGAAAEPEAAAPLLSRIRSWAQEQGKPRFTVARIAYVAVGGKAQLEEAVRQTRRYYPMGTPRPPEEMVKHGPPEAVAEWVGRNAEAGFDLTILFPQVPSLEQVELLAERVLPAYR
ncbi:MAG TPA: LLM class flavin-dependent oxidoreductase [Candidatus Dormibacteraeota bacterium]|jgi:alkanesulfonate monooxygenase SsuD/methylene tetrahydromethanopterin reductase-like flavin-dependent oxidoreductase (luciferase family)|nr:LLM class flavin-dependent oxidoreductase [Candidatus Dormibacteraeota bacterium]